MTPRSTKARRASWQAYDKARRACPEYKAKRAAQQRVRTAIKRGEIVRKYQCEECGRRGTTYEHHEDYSKPLEVEELCTACHRRRHPRPLPNGGRK